MFDMRKKEALSKIEPLKNDYLKITAPDDMEMKIRQSIKGYQSKKSELHGFSPFQHWQQVFLFLWRLLT